MNQTQKPERRLAAIFAADVAGYSRLIGQDEAGTLRALTAHRDIMDRIIAQHGGRIANTAGDSVLAEFPSVVDAVECAAQVQDQVAAASSGLPSDQLLLFRIGIHVGDVVVRGGDLLGDGVNIAARVQALANPGGVWLSEDAYRQLSGKTSRLFEDRGEQQLKNIANPVRLHALAGTRTSDSDRPKVLRLPDKPSIAVLPFTNMSGDPEQEYFADGIVEDIITALSRFNMLTVIARNSTFVYKNKPADIREIGSALNVRYVLEGSLRRSGSRVRITGQLIDADTAHHVWANRFDGSVDDIFELQDRLTNLIVTAVAPEIERFEIKRRQLKRTQDFTAYDFYLRGLAFAHQGTRMSVQAALQELKTAIEIDPHFAAPHGWGAWCHVQIKACGWSQDVTQERREAKAFVDGVLNSGMDDAIAVALAAHSLAFVVGDLDGAERLVRRAVGLNTNHAAVWFACGYVRTFEGDTETATAYLERATSLDPVSPLIYRAYAALGLALFVGGEYKRAIEAANESLKTNPTFAPALRVLAASAALYGAQDLAGRAMEQFRAVDTQLRLSTLIGHPPFRRDGDYFRYHEGLRRAGLPE